MLKGKTVILGITGSIAAYKMANVASMLKKLHCNVEVIMTKNAVNFINPITFETLTGNKCLVDTFDRNFQFNVEHVALAKRADVFMVAPASANIIGKIAGGIADDMLSTTIMPAKCPKIIAPAMNTGMIENPIVQDNIKKLESYGYEIVESATGYLACGDTGKGKLPDAEVLQDYILKDGKIHTRYVQDLTQTGRLSSVDPNLQNIPVRLEQGRLIRKAFVPSTEDAVLLSSDYSQIELRVLAHISGDEHLIAAFKEGADIHTSTAMRVFGIEKPEDVTPNDRRNAKAVNFGIVYGISDFGLSNNLGISRKKAKEYIDTYFERYPGIKAYMDNVVREAKDKGYVETLFHRRRELPDINSRNFNVRNFAERTAINSPIQGSAADILKIAMINLDKALVEGGYKTKMLLQVHDEIVLEVPNDELVAMKALVKETMEAAVELAVPLIADENDGRTWYEAK